MCLAIQIPKAFIKVLNVDIYKEKQVGFLGTSEEEYFFIHFDENGVAYKCDYGVRPGG